jgi:rhodanese-related sulfurtransferase/rubrerythrin
MKTLYPDEAKSFMDAHQEGSYTLLDVRQPAEYEQAHLPGAKLIPLPQLADSIEKLDPQKPTIVYCAVGGRSRMAAQLLTHHGLQEVYQVEGGIQAWEERTASGPREFHLKFIKGGMMADEMVMQAYRMEDGLKQFHQAAQARTTDREFSEVLDHLIHAEESHKQTVLELFSSPEVRAKAEQQSMETADRPGVMEGGIDIHDFLEQNEPFLQTLEGYLDVAMMIETQALDLYLRMAEESPDEASKKVLYRISEEEKGHLATLGRFLEGRVSPL